MSREGYRGSGRRGAFLAASAAQACLLIRQALQRCGTLVGMIVRERLPELRLVVRLHVDLLRVSSAVCMPAV
jgi:hypothetical protein